MREKERQRFVRQVTQLLLDQRIVVLARVEAGAIQFVLNMVSSGRPQPSLGQRLIYLSFAKLSSLLIPLSS